VLVQSDGLEHTVELAVAERFSQLVAVAKLD
jgi:hypothetical protein